MAEKVRVAVACFRAAEKHAGDVYVLLESNEPHELARASERIGLRRLIARRIYAGEHKNIEGRWTVVVGQDMAESMAAATVSFPVQTRNFEVTVRSQPLDGMATAFEGVFELKSIEMLR